MIPLAVSKSISAFLQCKTGKTVSVISIMPLGGGCINDTVKIQTTEGYFFVKYNLADAFPEMFVREAAGLQLLREAEEIRIPEVLYHDTAEKYSYLLLEFILSGNRVQKFWDDFGRTLASLHKHTQSSYGLDHDNYIGSLSQSNRFHPDWIGFFILERLEPMVRLARNKGEISSQMVSQFELLYSKLPTLIPVEKPALLHGDLWSGNYMVDNTGNPCLIDPAVYYGHREVDLAMTRLFGGFPPQFYDSYDNAFTLEKGWESRVDVFNLYPLLVHVNLFGSGYISQVKQILIRFV